MFYYHCEQIRVLCQEGPDSEQVTMYPYKLIDIYGTREDKNDSDEYEVAHKRSEGAKPRLTIIVFLPCSILYFYLFMRRKWLTLFLRKMWEENPLFGGDSSMLLTIT